MEMTDLTDEQFDRLAESIFPIIAEQGPSHTTMDYLARRLSMSKRTLYEIFGSKDAMITTIMEHLHARYAREIEKITKTSSNMMEVMANVMLYHQKTMSMLSASFFRDMDERCRNLRPDYESHSSKWTGYMEEAISLGVKQGVFRSDADYRIILPLIRIQMESLKRMEKVFPPDISIVQAYSVIALGFLRSIATPSGMIILDKLTTKFNIGTDNEI
ncbi:MAG: TetR/AcrR family transcriptional regulator [Muribaculaceae bacterium]|nr:TetR/AcrR family transcriptional regulator [Muribaculaceae bacterium]